MNDINDTLKEVYNANNVVVIPGSGSYAMEACARQFSAGKKSMVIRNGVLPVNSTLSSVALPLFPFSLAVRGSPSHLPEHHPARTSLARRFLLLQMDPDLRRLWDSHG